MAPTGSGDFATSADGRLLVYRHGVPPSRLVWMDRSGRQVGSIGEPGYFGLVRISPDGGRLVTDVENPATGGHDLWLYDLSTGIGSRLTVDPVVASWPIWSPDGDRIAFGSARSGPPDIYVKELGGPLAEKAPFRGSRRASALGLDAGWPVRRVRRLLPNPEGPEPDLAAADDRGAQASCDSTRAPSPSTRRGSRRTRASLRSCRRRLGSRDVYVAPVDGAGHRQRISPAGGSLPCWSADGKELFFQAVDGVLMAVAVFLGKDIQFSIAKPLFSLPPFRPFPLGADYDVSRDGQRFLVNLGTERASQPPLIVTLGWQQRLAGDRPGN